MDMLYQNLRKNDVIVPDKDILEAHGIEMSPVTDDELKEIKELMTSERGRLIRAWRVENKETRAAFEARKHSVDLKVMKEQLFYSMDLVPKTGFLLSRMD